MLCETVYTVHRIHGGLDHIIYVISNATEGGSVSLSNDPYFDAVRAALFEELGEGHFSMEMKKEGRQILMRRVGLFMSIKGYSSQEIRKFRGTVKTLYDFAITSQDKKWARW